MPQVEAMDGDCPAPVALLSGALGRWNAANRKAHILSLVGAVSLAAVAPETAVAHAIVVRTSPAQGGVAAKNIGKVDVWYDAGIRDAFAALAVVSATGERVDKRDAAIDGADPAHVSVSVNQLAPGKYIVRYRALSADGHLVSGAWDFEVRP
jgi:methionine-rich copper-binding protein CopC